MAAVMTVTKELSRTQLNWWGYDLEEELLTTHQGIEKLPFQTEVPGESKLSLRGVDRMVMLVTLEGEMPEIQTCS